jgi:protein-tyrosine kinase
LDNGRSIEIGLITSEAFLGTRTFMSRMHDGPKRVDSKRGFRKNNGSNAGEEQLAPTGTSKDAIPLPIAGIPTSRGILDSDFPTQSRLTTWAPDPRVLLRFTSEEHASGTEEFRGLRSKLYQFRERASLRKILVASALPREGRSFMAANLAQVMACQQECPTLLLDADLRTPSLHLALGTSPSPGLSEFLLGEADADEVIQRGSIPNLLFVPAGRPVSGQSELLSNGRFKLLLEEVSSLFEWIIIDSTATVPVSDSGIIANYCDGALMVVRSSATPFDVVRKARERLRPERLLGVVLNDVRTESDQASVIDRRKDSHATQTWRLDSSLTGSERHPQQEVQPN